MENEQSIEQEQETNSLDSVLGTFKDVEALKKSYDNLRSEFTRKSQELSRLNKLVGDKDQTPPNADKTTQKDEENNVEQPFWESENWQESTAKFFEEYNLTDEQKYQLAQILVQDKELKSSISPLHTAYIKLIKQTMTTKEDLLNNEEFLSDFVLKNENLKQKVIENYLNSIKKRDSVPVVMPSSAANFGEQSKSSPKTLNEAKQLASKYFD